MEKLLTAEIANKIYDILVVTVGARDDGWTRECFVHSEMKSLIFGSSEYRFVGSLGFGGKFRRSRYNGWYVDCYPEDENPARREKLKNANMALKELKELYPENL